MQSRIECVICKHGEPNSKNILQAVDNFLKNSERKEFTITSQIQVLHDSFKRKVKFIKTLLYLRIPHPNKKASREGN